MYQMHDLRYAMLDHLDAQIVELTYRMGEMSFVVVLPNEKTGLAALEEKLATVQLSELLKQTSHTCIDLYLPKFKIESTLVLNESMNKLGLEEIFGAGADLSGISTAPELVKDPLRVSDLVQTAFIEVNEKGTEAAAVTRFLLLGGGPGGSPPKPLEVKCDRPFAYFVVYKDLVVFSGRLVQP